MKQQRKCRFENEEHLTLCQEFGEDPEIIFEEISQNNSKSTPTEVSVITGKKQGEIGSYFLIILCSLLIHAGLFTIIFKDASGKGMDLTDIVIAVFLIIFQVLLCVKPIIYSLQ